MVLSGLGMLAAVIPKKPGGGLTMLVIPVCILMVLWFWTSLRLMALRLHDVNRSAKWVLALLLLPGLGKLTPALSGAQGAAEEQPGSGNVRGSKEKALASLRQSVQEISRTLPKKIDAVTTLTKVEVSGDIFRSYYMMDPSVHLDPSRKDVVEQAAKRQICGSSKRILTDNGITVEYVYVFSGPSGPETMEVFVPSQSCF
jgi:hypothetical protein